MSEEQSPSSKPQVSGVAEANSAIDGKPARRPTDRPSKSELEQQKRAELIAPLVEGMQGLEAKPFQDALASAVSAAKKRSFKRRDIESLLEHAMRLAPLGLSGACIVKFFKAGGDWNPPELVSAARALMRAVRARRADVEQLGPLVHGGLIPLLEGAKKQQALGSETRESDDVVAAFVALHGEIWCADQKVLDGLPGSEVERFLREFARWLCSMPERADIQGIDGQRLFGFGVALQLRTSEQMRLEVAPQASVAVSIAPDAASVDAATTPRSNGNQRRRYPAVGEPKSAAASPREVDVHARCKSEIDNLRQSEQRLKSALESAGRLADRLRSERDAANRATDEALAEAAAVSRQLERSIARSEELEAEVAGLRVIEAELAVVRETLAVEQKARAEIAAQLAAAEAAIETAKRNEFARGRREGWNAAAHQCVEPLEQIEMSAAPYSDDGGLFIRQMAKSLISYFRKGEGNA